MSDFVARILSITSLAEADGSGKCIDLFELSDKSKILRILYLSQGCSQIFNSLRVIYPE